MVQFSTTALLAAICLGLLSGCAHDRATDRSEGPAVGGTSDDAALVFPRDARAYVVSALTSDLERRWTEHLVSYVGAVLGTPAELVASLDAVPPGQPAIVLERGFDGVRDETPGFIRARTDEDYVLLGTRRDGRRVLIAAAAEPNGIRRAIQRMIITSQQRSESLAFPQVAQFATPWIEAREFEPSAWEPNYVRAKFWNPAVDPRVDLQRYGDEQLDRYIAMFDWFGFDGIRLEEGSWQWAIFGSQEASADFVKRVARIAKSQEMNRTLHILYADFHGWGWSDPTVKYEPDEGLTAYQDPGVRATFEKAYDYYASLAPHFDRIGGHLIDPGYLKSNDDMVAYVKLFREKVRQRNPDIALDVVMWAADLSLAEAFIDAGVEDLNILLSNNPYRWRSEEKQRLHHAARFAGLTLGYWSWGITDAEQDYTPTMYVNPQIISENYRMVRDAVEVYHAPAYWSEMEAYHLLNMFSMYVSGQLLWDPDRDPYEAMMEISTAVWGPRNGRKFYDVLRFIEDFRSSEYWRLRPAFGSEDPADDIATAERAIALLETLEPDEGFVQKLPLPTSPRDLAELIIPHLRQTIDFSRFRIELQKIEQRAAQGASKDELRELLEAAWQPVPEYNTWIGTPGPVEFNAQLWLLKALEDRFQITVRDPQWLIEQDVSRILQTLRGRQGYSSEAVTWQLLEQARSSWDSDSLIDVNFYALARYGRPSWKDRVDLMLERGDIVPVKGAKGETRYRLKDWRRWARIEGSMDAYAIQKDRR